MYNEFVNSFIDAQTASVRLYSEIAKAESALFGSQQADRAVRVPTSGQIQAELHGVYVTVVVRIVAAAGRSVRGRSRAVICREAGIDVDRALASGVVPDFDGLWSSLAAPHGGRQ